MRTINVCSGIGDNIWLLMKLINQPEQFNFHLPDGFPQRGKQIFDILPKVAASAVYDPKVKTATVLADANEDKKWSELTAPVFNLSCNHHLDTGNRIEKFLPDLPTSFILPYETGEYRIEAVFRLDGILTPGESGGAVETIEIPHIGIYSSSYRTTKAWNGWSDKEWFDLVSMIHKRNPSYRFVIIGADWDIDLETKIAARLDVAKIPYIKLIGQPLGLVCEVLKRLHYFIGFPSGLSILNETLGAKGTLMFYPKHLEPMQNAWADPARIDDTSYKGCQFCPPEQIFQWMGDNNKV